MKNFESLLLRYLGPVPHGYRITVLRDNGGARVLLYANAHILAHILADEFLSGEICNLPREQALTAIFDLIHRVRTAMRPPIRPLPLRSTEQTRRNLAARSREARAKAWEARSK